MVFERGWAQQDELTDEQLEQKRQKAADEYRKEIEALKQQEITLQSSVDNLQKTIDDANAARVAQLNDQETLLKSKLDDADNLNIAAKALNISYEQRLAQLAVETDTFNASRQEKQAEIDATIADLTIQKDDLAKKIDFQTNKEVEFNKSVIDHATNVDALDVKSHAVENTIASIKILQANADAAIAKAQQIEAENNKILEQANVIKSEYESKLSNIDATKEELAVLRFDLEARATALNTEKTRQNDQAVQLKYDRMELDKKAEALNMKQVDINTQTEKLVALKAQVAKES